MINYNTGVKAIINKKCIVCQTTRPNFGLPTDKTGKYCWTNKMIEIVQLYYDNFVPF